MFAGNEGCLGEGARKLSQGLATARTFLLWPYGSPLQTSEAHRAWRWESTWHQAAVPSRGPISSWRSKKMTSDLSSWHQPRTMAGGRPPCPFHTCLSGCWAQWFGVGVSCQIGRAWSLASAAEISHLGNGDHDGIDSHCCCCDTCESLKEGRERWR